MGADRTEPAHRVTQLDRGARHSDGAGHRAAAWGNRPHFGADQPRRPHPRRALRWADVDVCMLADGVALRNRCPQGQADPRAAIWLRWLSLSPVGDDEQRVGGPKSKPWGGYGGRIAMF